MKIAADDGVILRGELRRGGDDWVLLAHDLGEDLDSWGELPGLLSSQGMTVLAIDLRGHGVSDGDPDAGKLGADLHRAAEFAVRSGARRVYLGGAGQAGGAQLELSPRLDLHLAGLFVLSPRLPTIPRRLPPLPRLLVVATGEARPQDLEGVTVGWWVVTRIPVSEKGLSMLRGPWGTHIKEYVVRFLADIRRSPLLPARRRRDPPTPAARSRSGTYRQSEVKP